MGATSKVAMSKVMPSDAEILAQLTQATTELYWVSETDAPFAVQLWSDFKGTRLTEKKLRQWLACEADVTIETIELEAFLASAVTPQDWHGAEEAAIVQRYQSLLTLLQDNLANPKVYRVGTVNVSIYIIGKTPAGTWMALKTEAVET
jgi:hypothetical protein